MARAHPTPVVTTGIRFGHGSGMDPWRSDVDALKREIDDLRATVGLLVKEIKELKRVKTEAAALDVPSTPIRVKSEPVEAALEVDSEEDVLEQMEVSSQDTGDGDEQVVIMSPQRQSTEEPTWITPPWREVLFKVNPEHAQRIARANEIAAAPIQTPAQPREETPPPPPPSPPPAPVVYPPRTIDIIPASRVKRKHDFELIIEAPAKRYKASNYPAAGSSSGSSAASSSRITLDASPATVVAPAPVRPKRRSFKDPASRPIRGTSFVVDLDPKIRDVVVSRDFMGSYFGAHMRYTFSIPAKDKFEKHGYDHFVFINRDVNPQAPSGPGEPGIITLFDERPWPKYDQYRIFERGKTKIAPSRWKYIGLYKVTKLSAWTPEEVKHQPAVIKNHWAVTVRQSKWARPMVARIVLRNESGREPTKKDVNNMVQELEDGSVPVPSIDTIMAALENGEEKVYPWRLQCQGYEDNLQWEIAITFPGYEKGAKKFGAPAKT